MHLDLLLEDANIRFSNIALDLSKETWADFLLSLGFLNINIRVHFVFYFVFQKFSWTNHCNYASKFLLIIFRTMEIFCEKGDHEDHLVTKFYHQQERANKCLEKWPQMYAKWPQMYAKWLSTLFWQ